MPPLGQPANAADDVALVARVAEGDRDAFEQLYRRHAGWLVTRLDARCGDPDLTDIALQDTFLAVWSKPRGYRGDGAVGAWLWGIAIRRLIDQLRKRKAAPIDPTRITEPMIDADRLASGAVTGAFDAEPVDANLRRAIHALPPELRSVLIATAIDGLTTKEAAHLLGVPQGTVKTRLMRARHALQEVLA